MKQPVFKEVENCDVERMIAEMRGLDRVEIALTHPKLSIEQAVWGSVQCSEVCYAVFYDGELMCICGVARVSLRENRVTIWALGTMAMERRPRAVIRFTRLALGMLFKDLPAGIVAENMVWDGSYAVLQWLRHFGARFSHSVYHNDENFTCFEFESSCGGG